jgi:type IV pilus assembly protein PilW
MTDGGDPGGSADFVPTSPFVNHNDVTYKNFYTGCVNTSAAWNKAGVDLGFPAGSQLYNLGRASEFVSRVYAVRKGNLTVCDLTANDCKAAVDDPPNASIWTPIASGVVD